MHILHSFCQNLLELYHFYSATLSTWFNQIYHIADVLYMMLQKERFCLILFRQNNFASKNSQMPLRRLIDSNVLMTIRVPWRLPFFLFRSHWFIVCFEMFWIIHEYPKRNQLMWHFELNFDTTDKGRLRSSTNIIYRAKLVPKMDQ